jgi:hypothetical protein
MCEEPKMADTHEAVRQHVQKEPAQKLIEFQPHQPFLVLVRRVAPPKYDFAVLQRHQTVIGDGDAVRVAAEIPYCVLGPAEWALILWYVS